MTTIEEYTTEQSEVGGVMIDLAQEKKDKRDPLWQMANKVADETWTSVRQIRSSDRHQPLARARHLFMHRAHKAGYSMPVIGRFLNRDHTSVLYGIRLIQEVQDGKRRHKLIEGVA